MKTRNELQKEVEELQKTLSGISDSAYKSHEMNYVLRTENKQLQSELEVANNHVQHFQNQILEMVKEQNEKNNEWGNISLEYANQLEDIKSKSFFQLIRWWFNAKN